MGDMGSNADSKGAFRKEREAHQKLLADSHGLVMDLRWQIHHNEKNWNREKVELLDRLDRERREWGRQEKELLWRIKQVRMAREEGTPHLTWKPLGRKNGGLCHIRLIWERPQEGQEILGLLASETGSALP